MASFRARCSPYLPLLFAAVFCFVASFFDGVMQVLTERRAKQISQLPPLPDLGHSLLPHLRWWPINDVYIAAFALLTVLHFSRFSTLRLKVLRRFLFLEAVMLMLRGVSVVLTTLSIPLRDCRSDALGNPLIESLYILAYIHHTCADLLFSGHTGTYTLLALFWSHYSRGTDWKPCGISSAAQQRLASMCALAALSTASASASSARLCSDCEGVWLGLPETDAVGDPNTFHWSVLLPWLLFGIGVLLIISTRFHYSIDCYIAFCLTWLLFHLYHYYVKAALEQRSNISAFFRWFERLRRRDALGARGRRPGSTAEEGAASESEAEGEATAAEEGRSMDVLYSVSMLDGLKVRRPEEVGRLALATAIAEMEHKEHVVVTGGQQGYY